MNTGTELLSVIVPVWNNAETLVASLTSITDQDCASLEIIVVDDGSSDESAVIARQFDERVVCIRQENAGPSAARNRGLLAAKGKLISFLDADDRWPTGRVHHHLSILSDAPGVDMVIGTTRTIFPSASSGEAAHPPLPAPLIQHHFGSITIRRAAFDKVGLLDPSLRVGEDTDWFKRALAAGLQIRMTPTVALEYCQRRGSLTFGTINHTRGFIAALHDSLQRKRMAATKSPSADTTASARQHKEIDDA